jgi:hypothetical protein
MNEPLDGYQQRAERHRPTDEVQIAETIRRLHQDGLTAYDISVLLRIGTGAVLQLLSNV